MKLNSTLIRDFRKTSLSDWLTSTLEKIKPNGTHTRKTIEVETLTYFLIAMPRSWDARHCSRALNPELTTFPLLNQFALVRCIRTRGVVGADPTPRKAPPPKEREKSPPPVTSAYHLSFFRRSFNFFLSTKFTKQLNNEQNDWWMVINEH